jgi:hypothetical protein
MRIALKKLSRREITLPVILAIVSVLVILGAYFFLPIGADYHAAFRPAALAIARGENPYEVTLFYNPPWTLLPLLPIALLPEKLGNAILFMACLVAYTYLPRKLNASLAVTLIFLISPPVLYDLWSININWLVMLGYLMPPQIGLFFVLMKPQVGGLMALFWLVEAWREGGLRQVFKTFAPVTVMIVISLLIFPGWFLKSPGLVDISWNVSLWPLSIPIGLLLISLALRLRKARYAYMASPFLSPYVALNSYSTVILGLVDNPWEIFAAVVGMWIFCLLAL